MSDLSTIFAGRSDWLTKAGTLNVGQGLKVHPRDDLDWATARAALAAQYGKGKFTASTHGNVLWVQRVEP